MISGFCSCDSLLKLEIPPSVEIIASGAFSDCSSLREVAFARLALWK
jgi:hypothetical protein